MHLRRNPKSDFHKVTRCHSCSFSPVCPSPVSKNCDWLTFARCSELALSLPTLLALSFWRALVLPESHDGWLRSTTEQLRSERRLCFAQWLVSLCTLGSSFSTP